MKKICKIIISLSLVLSMTFFGGGTRILADEPQDVDTLIGSLIGYYRDGAETDVLRTLDTLKEVSSEDYETWKAIMDYWDYTEKEMVENIGVAPDGLPNDNSHAFIVLGFALNSDGTMKPELIGRLETALASAQKYPNSYVLVTGGVEKNGWTEGQRMHDWLVEHGVAEERILVETEAADTAGNAQNSFKILYNMPNIKTISMITSQYHLKRGTILYYAQSLLSAKELGKTPIELLGYGNAGYKVEGKDGETMFQKANSLKDIANVKIPTKLVKSKLDSIEISGKQTYALGEELDIKVTAHYDTGYARDVTDKATIVGFDSQREGKQEIAVVYTETVHESTSSSYDITKSNKLTVEVKKEDSGSGGTETPENPDTEKPETPEGNGGQDTNGNASNGANTSQNGTNNNHVSTGDTTHVMLYAALLVVSCIGIYALYRKNKHVK